MVLGEKERRYPSTNRRARRIAGVRKNCSRSHLEHKQLDGCKVIATADPEAEIAISDQDAERFRLTLQTFADASITEKAEKGLDRGGVASAAAAVSVAGLAIGFGVPWNGAEAALRAKSVGFLSASVAGSLAVGLFIPESFSSFDQPQSNGCSKATFWN